MSQQGAMQKESSEQGRVPRLLAVAALAAMLASCASQPGTEEAQGVQQQISTAERAGTLEELFEKLSAEAGKKKMFGGENKEAQAAMQEAGRRLAAVKQAEAREAMARARLQNGLLPLSVLAEVDSQAARMQRWDSGRQQELAQEIATERRRSQEALAKLKSAYAALPDTELAERHRLLSESAQLAGAGSVESRDLLQTRDQMMQEAYAAAGRAIDAQRFEEADAVLARILQAVPDYRDAPRLALQTKARQFEHLAAGRRDEAGIDQALALYAALSKRSDFADLKPSLAAPAGQLLQHLVARGGSATADDKLAEAYRWFLRAQDLRQSLEGNRRALSREEKTFSEQVFLLAEAAAKRNQPGLALGYLFAVQDVYPDYPALKRTLREVQDRTLDHAVKRITAAHFTGSGDAARLGGTVASKITQQLFQALPDDIRIVERDQLQAVMREQELVAMQGASNIQLASADYLVQGAILEASVENSEKKGRKTVRVVTRKNRIPNPAYAEWSRTKGEAPAPPEFREEPVYEDVSLNVGMHRKVGVLGVSYRIVDTGTARVLFTDTLNRKRTESGESSEGVQLGEFSAPMKFADLPSDSEILESLAGEVADHIGRQLVDFLRDNEVKYEAAARRHRSEENPAAAAEMLAGAWVLSQKKGKNVEQLGQELRATALSARPAG